MIAANPPAIERWTIAASLALLTAILVAVGVSALHLPGIVTIAIGLIVAAPLTLWTAKRLPSAWDGIGKRRPLLSALWLLLALAVLARTAALAVFMADPSHVALSAYGFDPFYIGHSCFSGYWQAAHLAQQGVPNLYDVQHYYGKTHGIFRFDEFLYLPQFLLLPMLGVSLGGDFDQLRAIWFLIEGGALLACMIALCAWIGERGGRRAALLIPAVWIATPVLLTLQLGNFQLTAVSLSAVAMALFLRERPVLGGALFGFAVFKLFPGILGIWLIATGRWKAVGWTLGFSLLYTAVAWLWFGDAPFRALFEYNLPRMATGESWAFLEIKELGFVAAINDSVPGLVYKLRALDVPGMSRTLVQQVSWAWTLAVIGLTVLSARRAPRMSRIELAANWLALLALASFRSPFLPDHTGLFALLWLALAAVLPFTGTPLDNGLDRFVVSGISQAIAIGISLWIVLRSPAGATVRPTDTLATPFTPRATET